jgi:hypothetical protein
MSDTFIFDTEVFVNCVLFCAESLETGKRFHVWLDDPCSVQTLRRFIEGEAVFIGFNSSRFDDIIVNGWLSGLNEPELKNLANKLIEDNIAPWNLNRSFTYRSFSSVDLTGASPAFIGLKALGARMNMSTIQDLPLPHTAVIEEKQRDLVLNYCWNDVETTVELTKRLNDQLALRVRMSQEYGVDLRSKSDAQLAERSLSITLGLNKRSMGSVPSNVSYTPPKFLNFEDVNLQNILASVSEYRFKVSSTGHVQLPDFLGSEVLKFGLGEYQLGVGGIHSVHDKKVCHVASDEYLIFDIDAASFYPSIIIECGFIPKGLGVRFVEEFRRIYERRLEAKRLGDKNTDASLKVTINSVFGQFGNRYSVLYSPDLMLAVTLTGQFTLLMLIEWLELAGAEILSANTDGIAVKYHKDLNPLIEKIVSKFSDVSKFKFEYTPYRVLAMKDCNNYFAVKTDRTVKVKGIYAPPDLKKNPTAPICAKAVSLWLAHGTPLLQTVKSGKIEEYLSARNVTGGGVQGVVYLGKVVRWYASTDNSLPPLTYAKNGNLVPKTTGARALMTMKPDMYHPADLDYDWYYKEALRIAADVGCEEYLTPEQIAIITPAPKVKKVRKTKEKLK